jgi:Tfp pilus assembly protein PilF
MTVATLKSSSATAVRPPVTASGSLAWPWSTAALALALALCAVAPYANTLLNGFVYDDNTQVMNNPYIQNFHHLREIFTTTVWSYIGAQGVTNYYRPMMTIGYLICYHVFGPLAYGFHLANVVLHAAVVCALFFVTRLLLERRDVALGSALIFALHPIHSESVAWIAAVTDLQVTFFYLLTFYFYLALPRSRRGQPTPARFGLVGSFALALLSKEQALTLPILATAYEHWYRNDRGLTSFKQKLSCYGALWLLATGYVLFRVHWLGSFAPVTQMRSLSWYQSLLSALALIGQYLGKMVWPAQLCAFYVFSKSVSVLDPRVMLGLAASALTAAVFVTLWRRQRAVSFGVLWFLVTLAPVLNARWMAANVFAERYVYLPSVGLCWIGAWSWARLWEFGSVEASGGPVPTEPRPDGVSGNAVRSYGSRLLARRVLVAVSCALAAACILRIVIRNRDWTNDIELYAVTLSASPNAYPIHNNLGAVYWRSGDVKAAEREWNEALRLNRQNAIVLNNLGLLCAKEKRYDDAVSYFRRAMRLKPNYTDPHLNLGSVYAETGQGEAAKLQLRAAVALSPLSTRARNELGRLYFDAGRLTEAEEQFHRSVESEPNVVAYDGLGDIYTRRGEREKGEEAFRRAVSLERFDSHGHFGLAALYADSGQNASAMREYQQGLKTDPANPTALAALGKLRSSVRDGKR